MIVPFSLFVSILLVQKSFASTNETYQKEEDEDEPESVTYTLLNESHGEIERVKSNFSDFDGWKCSANGGVSLIVGSSISRYVAKGLIGGYLDFEGEPKLRYIKYNEGSLNFPQYNRTYYFGEENYKNSNEREDKALQMCGYIIDEYDDVFKFVQQGKNQYISEIIYSCDSSSTCCDGLDCCIAEILPWYAVLLILFILLTFATGLLFACGRCLNKTNNSKTNYSKWKPYNMENNNSYNMDRLSVNTSIA